MSTQLMDRVDAPAPPPPGSRRRTSGHDTVLAALIAAVATTLTTLAVASLLSGTRWLLHALGAIVLVLALGLAARAVRLPRPAVAGVQLTACIGYVTAFYAGPVAVLGVIPGPAAWGRLRDRVDAAFPALEGVTPPFTPGNDVALLAVAGVIVTAIAVDALSVGYRRPLLAGIPLLTLYAVPASMLAPGPRTWLFGLPALALLLLFVGDDRDRLARWGPLGDRADLVRAGSRRAGAQIGFCVLAIALVVPALVPTLSGGLFDRGIGRQIEPITALDPLVEMRRNLVRPADIDLLNVTSDTVRPREQYLRTVTLDEFTGSLWRAADRSITRFDTDLPPPRGLSPAVLSTPVDTVIRGLDAFRTDYLPMPHPATRVQVDGNWRVDPLTGNVVSAGGREQAAGREYTVDSLDLHPRPDDVGVSPLGDPYLERYVTLPELPQRITDIAKRVTRGAEGSLEIGIRLQSWLRNPRNFTYDLRTPQGSGSDAVLDFLDRRRGYCEHFAATMAVMARALGVPARVNVGFTAGEESDGSRTVSAYDAHAWPELFLPEIGWVRFEPTPGSASSGPNVPEWLLAAAPSSAGEADGADGGAQPPPSADDDSDAATDAGAATADAAECDLSAGGAGCESEEAAMQPLGESDPGPRYLLWFGLFLLFLLLLAAAPWLIRVGVRHRRWASITWRRPPGWAGTPAATALIAEVAWVELRDTALDLGYAWPPACTPRQAAATLTRDAHLGKAPAAALIGITTLVEQARYSAGGGPSTDRAEARQAVNEVCAGLAMAVGRDARILARVAPRSLRTSLSLPTPAKLAGRVRGAARRVVRRPA